MVTEALTQLSCVGLFVVVVRAMSQATDFSEELAFYGSYHQDPVNQAIHFVFVPLVRWTRSFADLRETPD